MFASFRITCITICSVLSLTIANTFAATPISQVKVAIDGNQQQIDPLLSKGLATVLIRLTGDPKVTEQQAVVDMLSKPNEFLEQYQQQSDPAQLAIAFNQAAIEQTLNNANIAYWENRRPIIMVWWLNKTTEDSGLVGDAQPTTKAITEAANTQGFPVRFPIADLDEQALANETSFDAEPPSELLKKSEQYTANAILVVNTTQTADNYQAKWRLWQSTSDVKPLARGTIEATSQAQLAEQIFTETNPALAKVFVIKATAEEELEVVIKNVDFNRYVQVNNLMANFNGKVLETSGTTIRYRVKASAKQLKAQLGLLHFVEEKAETTTVPLTTADQIPLLTFHGSNN